MDLRKLGRSEIRVAPLAFGGNVFGWTADEQTSFKLLDAFVDAGFNLVDTADVYSKWVPGHVGGESETIIGKWLKQSGKRDRVVIATKVGMELSAEKKGLSRPYIMQAIEDSLRRLQTDYIDLYQSHNTNQRPADHPRGSCDSTGSGELHRLFKTKLAQRGIKVGVRANKAGCLDQCEHGPTVVVYPEGVWYGHVAPDDVDEIIESHILGNKPVARLVMTDACGCGEKPGR